MQRACPGPAGGFAVAAIACLLAACSFQGDPGGAAFRCGPDQSCQAGYRCDDGTCTPDDGDEPADAQVQPPDDAAVVCPGNLVTNPSFENGLEGWGGVGGSITQVGSGHDSDHAAQKCSDGSQPYYNVNDLPDSVTSTSVGTKYQLRGWLRSETDQVVNAVIRGKNSLGESIEQSSTPIVLKPDWQEVTVQHEVAELDATVVEVYFSGQDPDIGNCFQLDDICFVKPL